MPVTFPDAQSFALFVLAVGGIFGAIGFSIGKSIVLEAVAAARRMPPEAYPISR